MGALTIAYDIGLRPARLEALTYYVNVADPELRSAPDSLLRNASYRWTPAPIWRLRCGHERYDAGNFALKGVPPDTAPHHRRT